MAVLQVLEMLATDDSIVQKANEKSIEVSFVKKNVKIIGICFGFQYLAFKSGGKLAEGELFKGRRLTETGEQLYFNHHDRVTHLSKPWKVITRMEDFINIAATNKWIGFQFHPEKDPAYFNRYVLQFVK